MDTTTNRGATGSGSLNDDRNRNAEKRQAEGLPENGPGIGQPGSGQGLESPAGNYNPSGAAVRGENRDADFDTQHTADKNGGMPTE
jgi:hypothetical protein